jgi:tetratricopeptide (TPR) repeat protein
LPINRLAYWKCKRLSTLLHGARKRFPLQPGPANPYLCITMVGKLYFTLAGARPIILSVAVLLCGLNLVQAQTEKEIVAHYREALMETLNDSLFQTLELRGDLTVQKLTFPAVMFFKFPHHYRVEMTIQNLDFLQIKNDSLEYEYNPMTEEHLVKKVDQEPGEEKEKDDTFDYANHELLNYKESGHSLKLLRKEKLDTLEVFVLELTKNKSKKTRSRYFINTKTYLLHKVEDQKGFRYFADYTTIGSFVFPRFTIDSSPKDVMETRFRHVELNKFLPDSLFLIPQHALNEQKILSDRVESLMTQADEFYQQKQFDSAQVYYTRAIREDNGNFRAFNSRGLTRINLKEHYEAIADFGRALEINPASATAFNNRGLAKFYLGDREGAIKDYVKALEIDPDFAVTLKNRGTAHLQLQQYDQALQDFEKATTLNAEDGEAHYKKGVTLAQLEKFEDALASYALALRYNINTAEFYNYRGVSHYRLDRFDSARISFQQAVALDADNLQYLENYGRALYELGEYEAAVEQFGRYLKKDPSKAEIHNMIGLCNYQRENYKGAIRDFSKSIELNDGSAVYFDNRAAAREMIEDYEGAIKDYSESIRLYPNDASVFYKRGMIKVQTSRKLDGCLDLATAHDMKYEPAKEAIMKNCN